jgi:hypothetical protein
LALLLSLLGSASTIIPAQAATIVVNTLADENAPGRLFLRRLRPEHQRRSAVVGRYLRGGYYQRSRREPIK